MKRINFDRKQQRQLRHKRITNTLKACENQRPRLVVSKTDHHIYAQVIDDATGKVIASSSTLTLKLKNDNIANAKVVGQDVAKKTLAKDVQLVAFDRGGNLYHGKVKALADAAREAGLKF